MKEGLLRRPFDLVFVRMDNLLEVLPAGVEDFRALLEVRREATALPDRGLRSASAAPNSATTPGGA